MPTRMRFIGFRSRLTLAPYLGHYSRRSRWYCPTARGAQSSTRLASKACLRYAVRRIAGTVPTLLDHRHALLLRHAARPRRPVRPGADADARGARQPRSPLRPRPAARACSICATSTASRTGISVPRCKPARLQASRASSRRDCRVSVTVGLRRARCSRCSVGVPARHRGPRCGAAAPSTTPSPPRRARDRAADLRHRAAARARLRAAPALAAGGRLGAGRRPLSRPAGGDARAAGVRGDLARLMRGSLLEVLRASFVRSARARGPGRRARAVAARAAAGAAAGRELPRAGGGLRGHRLARGRDGVRLARHGTLSGAGRASTATTRSSWA